MDYLSRHFKKERFLKSSTHGLLGLSFFFALANLRLIRALTGALFVSRKLLCGVSQGCVIHSQVSCILWDGRTHPNASKHCVTNFLGLDDSPWGK